MSRKIALILGIAVAMSPTLAGCAPEVSLGAENESAPPAATSPTDVQESIQPVPRTQEENCGWDSARIDSGSATGAPSSPGADLSTVLIGAWQHTHINSGSGYEAVKPTSDIRYVFPSTAKLLYCQDVQGATSQAENAVNMQLEGTEIVLPSPATGYGVTAWNNDTMVWKNNRDGSFYLLKRR